MGKQASKALKAHEIESFNRQQNRMNNPNQYNYFGSTETTFDDQDQATIRQTLSEPIQGIIDSQTDFVSQGPAQLGQFSNPFLQGMMQGTANSIARRGGYTPPDANQMGGFNSSFPDFNQGPSQDEAMASMDLPGAGMDFSNAPQQGPSFADRAAPLAEALKQYGQAGNDPYSQAGGNMVGLMQKLQQRSQKGSGI